MASGFVSRKPRTVKVISQEEADELVRKLRGDSARPEEYRERSLKLHGWVCAKCGKEFDSNNLNLLTVHHKDGNHNNNPRDGSNWENLCIYCHENEHSRDILGNYLSKKE